MEPLPLPAPLVRPNFRPLILGRVRLTLSNTSSTTHSAVCGFTSASIIPVQPEHIRGQGKIRDHINRSYPIIEYRERVRGPERLINAAVNERAALPNIEKAWADFYMMENENEPEPLLQVEINDPPLLPVQNADKKNIIIKFAVQKII
ncbi:unnamed protein product [Aphis gossypii]|uniref:Uncharacterized protein n=1 Tax=Aphis gossypii TaxID=80765 RepID=A0A9P0IXF2_APHGO|nr:unnamed protein product [Aphis gossypii]